jgi:KTSC domain
MTPHTITAVGVVANMVFVRSSALRAVAYDPSTKELQIRFCSGTSYVYENVPATVHAALMAADSKGTFFFEHIRETYQCHKLATRR